MNWEAIGAIGELLSAIAVLATLIYLAVQVRNTKYELRRSFLQNRDNAVRELLLEGMRNSAFVSASSKAINTVGGGRPGLEAVKSIEGISDEEALFAKAAEICGNSDMNNVFIFTLRPPERPRRLAGC